MFQNILINRAIAFAVKTHEVDQKQKRKGKDTPYITHPLIVGLLIAANGGSAEAIMAGLLHDTVEDCHPKGRVTPEILRREFGDMVADLVMCVTEEAKELPWAERKHQALERIKNFSNDALLVKSADVLSNGQELVADYRELGDKVFSRFNAPKDQVLRHALKTIRAICMRWKENPLYSDLTSLGSQLQRLGVFTFMVADPAPVIPYEEYKENLLLTCPICDWQGTVKDSGGPEYYDYCLDVSCPICDKMLLVADYPHV